MSSVRDRREARNERVLKFTRPWLYPKQREAIFEPRDKDGDPARYSAVEASTKSGKTTGCIAWLFEQGWRYGGRNRNFWWVAPVYGQAEIAFRRMRLSVPQSVYSSVKKPPCIWLPNGSAIWFKSGEDPDALYGEDVYAVVVDEASRVREESWHALRSTLTATRGSARLIGNVKGRRNWFYKLCRRAEQGRPGFAYYKLIAKDAVDAGVLSQDEVEDARDLLPENVFRELYLAEASDDEGNPFGFKFIRACVKPLSPRPVVCWGWDLGKKRNWTVGIGLDENGRVARFERFQRPWPQTIEFIRKTVGVTPAKVDGTGLGDPVLEALQTNSFGQNYEGYLFTGPSKQKLMEGLAVDIQSEAVGYPEGPIVDELEAFEYKYTRNGVRYEAPEGNHDDCVDSLALAAAKLREIRGDLLPWAKL